jgi:hypothetical protein
MGMKLRAEATVEELAGELDELRRPLAADRNNLIERWRRRRRLRQLGRADFSAVLHSYYSRSRTQRARSAG